MSAETTHDSGTADSRNSQLRDDLSRLKREFQGKHDVFISFSSLNLEAIDTISECLSRALEPAGRRVWCSRKGLAPSDVWLKMITKKLGEARCFVLLLSADSLGSPWVHREIQAAVERHDKHGTPAIFCFRLDRVETHESTFELLLNTFQKVNEHVGDWRDDLPVLVEEVCRILEVPFDHEPWWRRLIRSMRRIWRGANTAVKIGLPISIIGMLVALGCLLWPPQAPTQGRRI